MKKSRLFVLVCLLVIIPFCYSIFKFLGSLIEIFMALSTFINQQEALASTQAGKLAAMANQTASDGQKDFSVFASSIEQVQSTLSLEFEHAKQQADDKMNLITK